jgi:phosphoserine phosphatase RsbU/P
MNWIYWPIIIIAALAVFFYLRRTRKERDALLQEKEIIFNFVHDVGEAFAESSGGVPHTDYLLKRVLFYAQQTTKARAGAIYFREPDGDTLRVRAVSGLFPPITGGADGEPEPGNGFFQSVETFVRDQLARAGEGLVGTVAAQGVPLLIEDAERDQRVPRFRSEFLQIQSILLVPMRFQNTVLGVLVVVNRIDDAPFIQADLNLLQALADQASVTIYYARFNEELEKKRVLDDDLRVARRIQMALLPTKIPQAPGLEIAAFSMPAREIGGDFYDFVAIDDEHIGLAIADVSGKGVTGAILMSICRSIFRAHAPGCLSPTAVLKAINRIIAGDIHEDMFISMLYCILDTRTAKITLACAGHPRPLLISAGGRVVPVEAAGVAIGLLDADLFDRCLRETTVSLQPGDLWILFTDGVTEAMNAEHQEWGLANLQRAVLADAGPPKAEGAAAVVTRVRQELLAFAGDMAQYDDMTLVVVNRS